MRAREDTRTIAFDWAIRTLPAGSRILRETFTPHVHLADQFAVTSVFTVGELSVGEIESAYDYVVTSSKMWNVQPDLSATSYAHIFREKPVFEIVGVHAFPSIRIHAIRRVDSQSLGAGLVLQVSRKFGFTGVAALADVDLRIPEPGTGAPLEVRAIGADPALLLPEVPALGPGFFLLRVSVKSPVKTTAQAFYRPRGSADFNESDSVRAELARGENQVDFRIGRHDLVGRIRLDLGDAPGLYAVDSVALYRLAEDPIRRRADVGP
jgi:hypothetical protein